MGGKGDVPSAIDQYNRWIGALWKLDHDREQTGPAFKPLFIGLHWPSEPWGEESLAPSFSTDGSADALLEAAVEHFGGSDDVRRPLKVMVIVDAFNEDPSMRELPADVVAAYHEPGRARSRLLRRGPAPMGLPTRTARRSIHKKR